MSDPHLSRGRQWLASIRRPSARVDAYRRTSAGPDESVARLLAAGRRLGSTVDRDEIIAILIEEATSLTDSDGVEVIDAAPDLDPERVCVVVPLTRPGAAPAAVVAWRSGSRDYDPVAVDLLQQLVPLAGLALAAAERSADADGAADTDVLTMLGNRRRLTRDLLSALAGSTSADSADDRSVGFIMVDIDHFARYNDANGSDAGDEALRLVASLLRGNVRDEDVVYRSGGEEFCVLLPNATQQEARAVAERVRRSIEECPFVGAATQPGGRLTISVAMTMASESDSSTVAERAGQAMSDAKRSGRNRVVEANA